jgi:fumarylpyruvate hydrolase
LSTPDHFVVPAGPRPSLPVRGSTLRFPVRRVYCIGRNYLAHIREMGEADERDPPIFFQKPGDAVVEPGTPLPYPVATADYQYEAELVVAIGRAGQDIPPEHALEHVYGYAVGLDMTRRDLQRAAARASQPWENGKSFDHSAPCSEVVPVALCGHPSHGALTLSVNGQQRQHTDLGKLIWSVPEIIARLSTLYRLMPGDLIYTGTPDGVGPVKPGDTMVASVEGVGTLSAEVVRPSLADPAR